MSHETEKRERHSALTTQKDAQGGLVSQARKHLRRCELLHDLLPAREHPSCGVLRAVLEARAPREHACLWQANQRRYLVLPVLFGVRRTRVRDGQVQPGVLLRRVVARRGY